MRSLLDWTGQVLLAGLGMIVAAPSAAQGVEVKPSAMVLYGSASNTVQPATIDLDKVEKKTPEYQTIQSEGVNKGCARYALLIAKMQRRIKAAVKAAARAEGCDCVIREGDITDRNGLTTADLTEEVIERLESGDQGP